MESYTSYILQVSELSFDVRPFEHEYLIRTEIKLTKKTIEKLNQTEVFADELC